MKWIVSELFHPDEVSTAQIMTEISAEFAKEELIGVICGPSGYEKSYDFSKSSLDNRIEVHRVSSISLDKNSIVSRILKMLFVSFKMAYAVARKVRKNDDVLIVTNPAFLLILIAILKFFKKFKLSILVHDVFPENLIPAGLANANQLKYKLTFKVYNWAYNKADTLIAIGHDMKVLLSRKLNREDIAVIPNWADPSILSLQDVSAAEYFNLPLSDKVVICFAGNIGRVQGLDAFINLFIQVSNPQVALLLIGDGAMKQEITERLENEKISNIYMLGSKPRTEQNLFLNAADISLIVLKEGMKGLGVPSKSYNIMASGKPILYVGDKGSEIDNYISEFDNGWSFSWDTIDGLKAFLKNLNIEQKSNMVSKGNKGRVAVDNFFSKDKVLPKFIELIK